MLIIIFLHKVVVAYRLYARKAYRLFLRNRILWQNSWFSDFYINWGFSSIINNQCTDLFWFYAWSYSGIKIDWNNFFCEILFWDFGTSEGSKWVLCVIANECIEFFYFSADNIFYQNFCFWIFGAKVPKNGLRMRFFKFLLNA